MKLERFFSMLAPTRPQLCLLLSKQGLRHLYICWDFRLFFCLSHHCCQQSWTLPQSSLGYPFFSPFFFFFCTFTTHLVIVMQIWICPVVWILDSFVVPTLVYNKALREGFIVCEHHKCFILPMHRLGCWKERLLYSVPALVCAISLMSFCVYLIAAVFFSIPSLQSEKSGDAKPLY